MSKILKTVFSTKWHFSACGILAFGLIIILTQRPVAAAEPTHQETDAQPVMRSAIDGFEFSHIWRENSSGDAGVFFTRSKRELWHSTKTGQRLVLSADTGKRISIAGITKQYIYLHNSEVKADRRIDFWRLSITGDPSTLRLIKTFASPTKCFGLEFNRTTDDQYVVVINVHLYEETTYSIGKVCRPDYTRGVFVFRVGDDEDTMTNIGRGLPNQSTFVHSTGVGDIFDNKLYMFTAKHEWGAARASKTGLYKVSLFSPTAQGFYQFPPFTNGVTHTIGNSSPRAAFRANHETEVRHNYSLPYALNTVKGATLLYSRVDAKIGSGCELWRFNGTARGAGRVSQLNTDYGDDDCRPELALAFGNRLIFKKINFRTNTLEIWETRGSPASSRILHKWTAPPPGLLQAVENDTFRENAYVSLQVIGNRIWFVKRTTNNSFEVWRSSSLRSTTTTRFRRMWRSRPGLENVRVLKAFKTPLVLVSKDNTNATLFRMNPQNGQLVKLVSGAGMGSNITTVDGEAIFAFKKIAGDIGLSERAGLYSLKLNTGELTTRKIFR